jgi:hypothetical protein
MLKKLPFKKEYLLIPGIVVLFLVCYRFAFENTVVAWQRHQQLNQKVAAANDLSYQPGYSERKNKNLDKIMALYKADTTLLRSNIINTIALQAEQLHVKLTAVPAEDALYHNSKFIIQKLNFEGSFFDLNRFLNKLQTLEAIGMIRCVDLKLITPRSGVGNEKKLTMQVYLELSTAKR